MPGQVIWLDLGTLEEGQGQCEEGGRKGGSAVSGTALGLQPLGLQERVMGPSFSTRDYLLT